MLFSTRCCFIVSCPLAHHSLLAWGGRCFYSGKVKRSVRLTSLLISVRRAAAVISLKGNSSRHRAIFPYIKPRVSKIIKQRSSLRKHAFVIKLHFPLVTALVTYFQLSLHESLCGALINSHNFPKPCQFIALIALPINLRITYVDQISLPLSRLPIK